MNRSHIVWREKMSYAFVVEKGCKGKTKNTYPIAFKAEVKHLEWLDNCFIGRTVEPSKAKDLKETFILGGLNFICVCYLGGNCVLLSGEDANLIKKSIDENKEWFESIFESVNPWEKDFVVTEKYVWACIKGMPLNLWSRQSLESIVSMVRTLVEIDKSTLEMEELKYARENSSDDDKLRSNLEGECFVLEGSEIGRNLKIHSGVGEETTVEEVEELICSESQRPHVATEDIGADMEGQQLNGLQNDRRLNEAIDELGGQSRCFNEVIDELEEEPRQFNVAIKETGDQMQTLT
ncbi:hypothetical protein VNO80_22515 [Phaseolus coccineus]|uniref:DUF4283 domain-containing protein n=1 Tax=Phaseolus coccineus TaxID=3886 RepID=A0AAN9M4B0_PHACN